MRHFFLLFAALLFGETGVAQVVNRCATESVLFADSRARQRFEANEKILENWLNDRNKTVRFRSAAVIPVVVHVVWNEAAANISDAQIHSQIAVLNADFRKKNCEIHTLPAEFSDDAADMEIEFCLAQTDPEGQLTTGITRTRTSLPRFDFNSGTIFHSDQKGKDAWDTRRYLNIWVTNLGGTLGFATPPGMGQDSSEDGVMIDYRYFGTIGEATAPYHLGRTTTHEIGHYFNLLHIFGDDGRDSCNFDDGLADTPLQGPSYNGKCPKYPQFSCGTSNMFMNFMDYTNDACMGLFTNDQKGRMIAALHTLRSGLLAGGRCDHQPVETADFIFAPTPNPARSSIRFKARSPYFPKGDVKIFDLTGRLVFEQTNFPLDAELTVEHWGLGVYFVEIRCGAERWIGKFLKI